jgi:hypothetical protein
MGAVEGVDIGLRLAAGSSIDLNGKVNFLRTRYFDMAVMPGVQLVRVTGDSNPFSDGSGQAFFFHVPLLMGINVSPTSTILINTGGAYLKAPGDIEDALKAAAEGYGDPGLPDASKADLDKKPRAVLVRSAAFVRAGLGFSQRIGRSFAIVPEVSFLFSPDEVGTQIINFGLGFNIGAQPAYTRGKSDEWSEDEAVDRPEAADKSVGKTDVDPDEEIKAKTKPAKIKVEQDPYEVEKEKKAAEEKKRLEEEEAAKAAEEEKAAEEAKKKKKKKK